MNMVVSLISRMAVFMICARTIIHFRPNRSYERYLKLLAGMMVIVQLFLAGAKILHSDGEEDFEERIQQFAGKMDEEMKGSMKEGDFVDPEYVENEVKRMQEELYESIVPEEEGRESENADRDRNIVEEVEEIGIIIGE